MTHVEMRLNGLPDLRAFVELVGPDLDIRKMSLTSAEVASIEVAPGEHLMRMHWSDGRNERRTMRVGAEPQVWVLEPPETEPPPLLPLGDPVKVTTPPRTADAPDGASGNIQLWLDPASRRSQEVAAWMHRVSHSDGDPPPLPEAFELWRCDKSRSWHRLPFDASARPIVAGVELELSVGEGLHVVKVHGPGPQPFVSLPSEQVVVGLRWSSDAGRQTIRVDARTTDHDVEALRGYLARGEFEAARALAPGVLAERLLRAKVAAPRIAALGGYVLLRLGEFERLHDWPDNLTRWKPWLPDGPVIAAWQRLRSPNPDYEQACALLLEAASRGLPVYSEGMRLLKDGLDMFDSDVRDWHVHDVARRVEASARAMVWDKPETTYFGDTPDRPSAPGADPGYVLTATTETPPGPFAHPSADEEAIARALQVLDRFAMQEYGQSLEQLLADDQPVPAKRDTEPAAIAATDSLDAFWRVGRLIGITVKEPFATARKFRANDPPSQTGARQLWKLNPLDGARPDLWQYRFLTGFLEEQEHSHDLDWLPSRSLPEVQRVELFLEAAMSERGLFRAVTLAVRRLVCRPRGPEPRREQVVGVADPHRPKTIEEIKRVVDQLTSLVPWLAQDDLALIRAGLGLLIVQYGWDGFCRRPLPAPRWGVVET